MSIPGSVLDRQGGSIFDRRQQHESAALREFVVSFGRLLPLHKPSPFDDKAIIQKLMVHGGGLTGKTTSLLAQAAELAIRKKTESISLDLLIEAAAAGIFKLPAEQEIDDALEHIRK